ncbi:hypothetical protein LUZ62_026202 [Rhynchospora pubera]|uniref:Uncharacterized protein n=1 Tax=Rhynchospora pubera TaxID=906938 RepID=A0AAV8HBX1_9POAL|nr:hypothetical protein LUZ62_026202 [Rhynchospora pubera]
MNRTFDAEAHCITIEEQSLKKGKEKLGEPEEAEIETDVNTDEEMNSQAKTVSLTSTHGIPIEGEPSSLWDKMHRELSKLPKADDSQEVSIFRVPLSIRESNKNMFEPSTVSIGPYYRGRPHLRAMEEYKWLSLRDFLNFRVRRDFINEINEVGEEPLARALLQVCISKIKKVEQRARCCYSEPFHMSSDDFVQMMVLDGFFILAFFTGNADTAAKGWISSFIRTDFILLENQIPFFIIETLRGSPFDDPDIMMHIARYLTCNKMPINALSEPQKIHHLLHLCLCSAVPTVSTQDEDAASEPTHCPFLQRIRAVPVLKCFFRPKKEEELDEEMGLQIPCATVSTQNEDAASEPNHSVSMQDGDAASEPNHCPFLNWVRAVPVLKSLFSYKREDEIDKGKVWEIPCATELEEAGVKFKKLEHSSDITKITFQSGTLVIPRIRITDPFKPLFMNLIALEQCTSSQLPRRRFSTYMMFLDCLVNTPHDVQILQKHGIIENMLSGEEEVALFFNQSGVGVLIDGDHYLADLFKRVNKHCGSRYHRYRAKLSRDYFNNPWSIIALIAATLLLCLTILQSFMSVYAYIRPPPSSPP